MGSDRLNSRLSGQAKLLHFLRAFAGLTHVLRRLDVTVFWFGPFKKLYDRRAHTLIGLELPDVGPATSSFSGLAKNLQIRVLESGREKVALKLPASAVDRLHDLLDEDVSRSIAQRNIDVDELIRRVRERLYAPQEVFALDEGDKRIEVSLV